MKLYISIHVISILTFDIGPSLFFIYEASYYATDDNIGTLDAWSNEMKAEIITESTLL